MRRAVITLPLVLLTHGAGCVTDPTEMSTDVILRDDFNGGALDGSIWYMPVGPGTFINRTQMRPPSQPLAVADGVLRLRLDTHNPTALTPGDSFWGSEVVTHRTFSVDDGLAVVARVRVPPDVPGGLVASVFSYALRGSVRDEIDFEILTNAPAAVLTNVFTSEGFGSAGRPLSVGGLTPGTFNELAIHWYPDRIEWRVNGQLVRRETLDIPSEAMDIRLNLWAPGPEFAAAFDPGLQPAATPDGNRTYFYEIDYVAVLRP